MIDLGSVDLASLLECSAMLRLCGDGVESMEAAAGSVVKYIYDTMREKETGAPALALVRLYKTHRWDDLDPDVADWVAARSGRDVDLRGINCLTLLASRGAEPPWNDRRQSRDHQAIPLSSPEAIRTSPMVSALFAQLGLDVGEALSPGPTLFRTGHDGACGVFYVPEALGSEYVPAQDFVRSHEIRSVVGFGGVLPDGHMFAVVMFATVPVAAATADQFATLAFAVSLALLSFAETRVFDSEPASAEEDQAAREARTSIARATALDGLLSARQRVMIDQSIALERAAREAQDRADALQRSQDRLVASEAFKSAILNSAMDCIVTIDHEGRVLEFNPAAERTFGYSREDAIGRTVSGLLIPARQRRAHSESLATYLSTGESRILNERIEVKALRADGSEIPVELAVTRAGTDDPAVFVGYMRDLSSRRAIEAALDEASRRSAHIARTLQTSLLPPTLPAVNGLDLAASYRAGGDGYDVGGDFYDVFEVSDNDWAFILGDVMGKGPEAAVVTALARYTVRAAAMQTSDPDRVLSTLNDAIYRQHPDRPCTAAYGWLRRSRSGFDLVMGSGGHVPALIRKADGRIIETAAAGLLLGPFPQWSGTTQDIQLGVGDLLLLYSDGVTESRQGQDLFGSERLEAALADTRNMDAHRTVDSIDAAVSRFAANPTDDLAMLAIRVT